MSMHGPLLTVDGMISGGEALACEDLLDHAVIDADGRLLVALIDVLAIVRLDADAELLLVDFTDGSSRAFRVPEVLEHEDLFIRLPIEAAVDAGPADPTARLWSQRFGLSPAVRSIHATSFASFVGAP